MVRQLLFHEFAPCNGANHNYFPELTAGFPPSSFVENLHFGYPRQLQNGPLLPSLKAKWFFLHFGHFSSDLTNSDLVAASEPVLLSLIEAKSGSGAFPRDFVSPHVAVQVG